MCNNYGASFILVVKDQPSKSVSILVGKIFKTTMLFNFGRKHRPTTYLWFFPVCMCPEEVRLEWDNNHFQWKIHTCLCPSLSHMIKTNCVPWWSWTRSKWQRTKVGCKILGRGQGKRVPIEKLAKLHNPYPIQLGKIRMEPAVSRVDEWCSENKAPFAPVPKVA